MSHESLRVITELDAARIRELGARLPDGGRSLEALGGLIDLVDNEAEIVPGERIDPDVATVNSTVTFRDETDGSLHRVTLVYPHEMSWNRRRISVLSPVGRALLGLRVGRVGSVELPDGSRRGIRLQALHYQPEASGHFAI